MAFVVIVVTRLISVLLLKDNNVPIAFSLLVSLFLVLRQSLSDVGSYDTSVTRRRPDTCKHRRRSFEERLALASNHPIRFPQQFWAG